MAAVAVAAVAEANCGVSLRPQAALRGRKPAAVRSYPAPRIVASCIDSAGEYACWGVQLRSLAGMALCSWVTV